MSTTFLAERAKDFLASSTQIEQKPEVDIKLQIAAALRKESFAKLRHSLAVRKIQWDKLGVEGFEAEELQEHLQKIIKSAGTVRTLDEVLTDYERNHVRYNIFSHPDHPTRPANAQIRYIMQNREKLTQKLEKQEKRAVTYVSMWLEIH